MNLNYSQFWDGPLARSISPKWLKILLLLLVFSSQRISAQCTFGDQVSYGEESWIGYVYFGNPAAYATVPPSDPFASSFYAGYLKRTPNFDMEYDYDAVFGPTICSGQNNNVAIRHKMKKYYAAGTYTFTVGGDDGYRLSIDGGSTYLISNWADHGYTMGSQTVNLTAGYYYLVFDYYENTNGSRVSFFDTSCTGYSTAPTTISGITTICRGTTTTLIASGGVEAPGSYYEWGYGTTAGYYKINGQNGSTLILAGLNQTDNIWVRRVDAGTCSNTTIAAKTPITVIQSSTAPTSITGNLSVCPGVTTVLTASGGTAASGSSYQWGTGSVIGDNIIAGQTGISISVTPTSQTTYWVRRVDTAPCPYTAGVTATVLMSATPGNPSEFGDNTWNVYGFKNADISLATAIYSGYYSQNTLGFNTQTIWHMDNSPSSSTIWEGCPIPNDQFTFVHKRKGFPCGTYTLTMLSGDDNCVVYVNGVQQFSCSNWSVCSNAAVGNFALDANSTIEVRTREDGGGAHAALGIVLNSVASTAPTSTTGTTSICQGESTVITASGGTHGSTGSYQWGTGNVAGTNIISGNASAITLNPSATTTYWVRRVDSGSCGIITSAIFFTVTVNVPGGNPSLAGENVWNVYGYINEDITLTNVIYAGYYTQSTLGFDTASGTNGWSATSNPSASAGWSGCAIPNDLFTTVHKRKGFPCGNYTVRMTGWDDASVVFIDGVQQWNCNNWSDTGSCNGLVGNFYLNEDSVIEVRTSENFGNAFASLSLVNNTIPATAPTSISANTSICPGFATLLTATGGSLGNASVYQWGTGTTIGENIISGQSGASMIASPSATTTYWVRRYNPSCNIVTAGITQMIFVTPQTVAGTLSTLQPAICKNHTPNDLTLSGITGIILKWQRASNQAFTANVTDIASTSATLDSSLIGPLSTTQYFRAVVQNGNCDVKFSDPLEIRVSHPAVYSNGNWSETPTAASSISILDDLTLSADMSVCSCEVSGNAVLTIASNKTLTIEQDLTVAETAGVIVQNNGSLVQIDDNAVNSGKITYKRNSTRMKIYDFTYWSSPVQNWTLYQLSPNTLSDKYYSFNPLANAWATIAGGNQAMAAGSGYIVRAPQGWSVSNSTSGIYNASFTGIPNNGIVSVPIVKGNSAYNLIGNPYPSAIDIDLFLTDPANENIVNGTVYLWTHNTAISSALGVAGYTYTADDYAKYNFTGGVKTASTALTGGVAPNGKIAAGQAFFIEANPALANGNYTAQFNNAMRISGGNNQFFRYAHSVQSSSPIEKHRVWLTIGNSNGAFDEMLVGYVSGATNGKDLKYDGAVFAAGNNVSLYSILDSDKLSIQGRALPFADSEIIPMGYKTTVAGNFTISLEQFDGLFQNQNVYLLDNVSNTYHDLKLGSYAFASAVGTFDGRFELRFAQDASLGSGDHADRNALVIYKDQSKIVVNSSNAAIAKVELFDLTGRTFLSSKEISTHEFATSDLNIADQVLIVRVLLEDGSSQSRKIIMY